MNKLSKNLLLTVGIGTAVNMFALAQVNAVTRQINPGLVGEIFEVRDFDLSFNGLTLGDLENELSISYSDNKFLRHGTGLSTLTLDINLDDFVLSPERNFVSSVFYLDENGNRIGQAGTTNGFLNGPALTLTVDFNETPQNHYGIEFDFDFRNNNEDKQISSGEIGYSGQSTSWLSLNDTLPKAPDLGPGDQFQFIFVTNDFVTATDSSPFDPDFYNNFAQAQAELNPELTRTDLGVEYKAFASFSGDFDALGNPDITTANFNRPITAPLFLLDGTFIAQDIDQLCDPNRSNSNFIDKTQFGNTSPVEVWTGTIPFIGDSNGFPIRCTAAPQSNYLGLERGANPTGEPTSSFIGSSRELLGKWIGNAPIPVSDQNGNPFLRPIYAVSSPITISGDDPDSPPPFNPNNITGPIPPSIPASVPEPNSLISLLALGIVGGVSKLKKRL